MSGESDPIPARVKGRSYVAPRRVAKAADTRRRIVAAAQDLFVTKGYAATTVDDIAAAAGVSRPTVFVSVGGKPELLKLARDVALAGDDRSLPMPQRSLFQQVWDEPDAARTLQLYARNMRRIYARAAQLELEVLAAGRADPGLAALAEEALKQRRHGCGLVATSVAGKAPLRDGLTVRKAGDVLYVLASPDTYRLLVTVSKWSPAGYQDWLGAALTRELLG